MVDFSTITAEWNRARLGDRNNINGLRRLKFGQNSIGCR
jgi:hypothetical protein